MALFDDPGSYTQQRETIGPASTVDYCTTVGLISVASCNEPLLKYDNYSIKIESFL